MRRLLLGTVSAIALALGLFSPEESPLALALFPFPAVPAIVASGGTNYALTYSGVQTSTSSASSFNFPGFNIGAANSKRYCFVAVSYSASADAPLVSIDYNGSITPTLARNDATNTSLARTYIYYASVPTGTTLDVNVGFGGGTINSGIAVHVWHAGVDATSPLEVGGGNATSSNPITVSDIDVTTGGFLIAIGGATSAATAFDAWTYNGVDTHTERTDGILVVGISHIYSAIDVLATETVGTNDVTCNITGGNRSCMSAMSWGT